MADKKIEILKNEIASHILKEFNWQIDEILSICHSETQKLMILHLYNYFLKFKENHSWSNRYYGIEFFDEEICLDDFEVTKEENNRRINRVAKYNHRSVGHGIYHKFVGFRVKDDLSEGFSLELGNTEIPGGEIASREFEICPQYSVMVDEKEYLLDIAIIMYRKRFLDGEIIETRKIALEFYGYDYLFSPEQNMNDNIRMRKLKKSGWKEVLRYSDIELKKLKSQEEIHNLFTEIIEVLYV
jgi:hypothetical protein